jgi:hypothetical protein
MKKTALLFILVLCANYLNAQKTGNQTYEAENNGYFVNPIETNYGILFTDNYASTLYILNKSTVYTLFESPGCGRYIQRSPDKNRIGFKMIDKDGKQKPAYYDLKTSKIVGLIDKAVDLCGQPSFSENGYAFTIGKTLYIHTESTVKTIETEQYTNLAVLSPDGNYIVYDFNQTYLTLYDLNTDSKLKLPNDQKGVIYPKWSPDSKKILFQNKNKELFVYELQNKKLHEIGEGMAGQWDTDSKLIVFQRTKSDTENFILQSSEIYISDYQGQNIRQITTSADSYEMTPSFDSIGNILYQSYDKRQIIKAQLNDSKNGIHSFEILLDNPKDLHPKHYNTSGFESHSKEDIFLDKDVEYVHQLYDAPTGRDGGGACAPTTSVMTFIYYNRLPKWPVEALNYPDVVPENHTSNFSGYVLNKYRYNNFYLEAYSPARNSYGGYAYMWISPYSSPANWGMMNYQELHNVESGSYIWTSNCHFENTTGEIDNQYPHPICSWITQSGHLTLAVGYIQDQHTVIFNDPWGDKNTEGYPSYDGKNSYYDWPGFNNGYQNLDPDGSHGTVAWTLTARSSETEYNDMTIDDTFYDHGFYMKNDETLQQYYRSVYTGAAHNDHLWWTAGISDSNDDCYVRWTPELPEDGIYKVTVHIPGVFDDDYDSNDREVTNSAYYRISHNEGTTIKTINQSANQGNWVNLGVYNFTAAGDHSVYLGDSVQTSDAGKKVLFDAVRFEVATGSKEITSENIQVYPNPAQNYILLNFDIQSDLNWSVHDISGKKVLSGLLTKTSDRIDIQSLSNGLYILKISHSDNNFFSKFVKE